ncbi:MAG: hypothetical protein IPG56_15570 [Caulobacteraceae bacterium]|nr:hypothetical protein [Caulobacteraceae bacterium]
MRRRDPARAAVVLQGEADALTALQQNGYADAAALDRRVVVDHASAQVATEYRFSVGELARLGSARAEPGGVLRQGFVGDLQNWDNGRRVFAASARAPAPRPGIDRRRIACFNKPCAA